ncbi:MAG: response regulator transcription factor [Kurthia sp.]|nr:response regulator transcription factor [Candidatus Kurthia equi]
MNILIVDDERDMRDLISLMLSQENMNTFQAENGRAAYQKLAQEKIDLVLLDVMMPDENGFQVCASIRRQSNVPVIFLTAKDANEDKVRGLTLGGDDYIVKPFSATELVARIQAVMRRYEPQLNPAKQHIIISGDIVLDEIARRVTVEDREVPLTLKEFDLLHLFMKQPNIVYTREQLLEKIWSLGYAGGTRTVDTHIKTLRLKLGKEYSKIIQTVWGIGYRFEERQ